MTSQDKRWRIYTHIKDSIQHGEYDPSHPLQTELYITFALTLTFVQEQVTRPIESMAPSSTSAADLAHIQEVSLQRLQGGYTSIYFASVIAAIILLFACVHWLQRLYYRLELRNTSFGRPVSNWSTPLKKSLYGSKIYGIDVLPERVALAIVYFGVNVGVSVWDIDWHHYTTFANRLGW